MRMTALVLLCAILTGAIAEWTPPDKPDPQTILDEAQDDARDGRYADALAKHLWLHANSLKHDPAFSGVRLSFAIGYWHKLGEKYPPALSKLKETRDTAGKGVAEAPPDGAWRLFQEFASINRELDEEAETTKLFHSLVQQNPPVARKVFHLAMPALIRAREYRLCGKYLDPQRTTMFAQRSFQEDQRIAKEDPRFGQRHLDFAEKKFTNEMATLIGLLVVNDRKDEAMELVAEVMNAWENAGFHAAIEKALEGHVPDPWP